MVFRTFAESFPYVSLCSMKESDFLLIGSKQEHKFRLSGGQKIYDNNPDACRSDLEYLGLSDVYAVQGFTAWAGTAFWQFSKGADDQYRRRRPAGVLGAEKSAPGRPPSSTDASWRRFWLDSPPWLKSGPLPVPEAMHHFYMAQSYLASCIARLEASKEIDEADPISSQRTRNFIF